MGTVGDDDGADAPSTQHQASFDHCLDRFSDCRSRDLPAFAEFEFVVEMIAAAELSCVDCMSELSGDLMPEGYRAVAVGGDGQLGHGVIGHGRTVAR
jgi:hypothetical protein